MRVQVSYGQDFGNQISPIQILIATVISLFFILLSGNVFSETKAYSPPQTAFNQPDFQGTWFAAALTPLERPRQVPALVIPEENAKQMVKFILAQFPDNIDPQFAYDNVRELNQVQGQYRTSQIVQPENGLMPYTALGNQWADFVDYRDKYLFNHPEQLAKFDRCLDGLGMPPIRMFGIYIPHLIVQTPEHVMIYTEDPGGARIIPLNRQIDPNAPRTWKGNSVGHWDGNTLVVNTSRFRGDYPTRFNIGRPLLIGANTTVTEHFTLVSENELLYRYTVDDPDYYTQPWAAEFSFTKSDAQVYEYGCHEGNYAMEGMMRGNQKQQAESAATIEVVARPIK